MTIVYPIIFHEEPDGHIEGVFPDLTGCRASGPDLELAIRDAMEAEYNWIMVELEDEDAVLPPVSHLEDLALKEGEFARNISVKVRFVEGWEE